MIRRTPLYIVCSPRPRVGRTLLARLLVDYFLLEGRPVAAFDFSHEAPALARYLPRHTVLADIGGIRGQMAVFDRLIAGDRVAKVVDLAPSAFEQFFAVLRDIGFVEDARLQRIEPVALFMANADSASTRSYAMLRARHPEMLLVPVYNEAAGRARHDREAYPLSRAVSVPIHIPALPPALHRFIDKPPFCFADFRTEAPAGIPLDTYMNLHRWMRRVFVEFRELELRLLLTDVKAALSHG
ncbi:hypothetical protein [Bradyrhizobium sp.]|uniref:hypothetical protein n=1 Tax=Bradyrhizobium sp. TaxID=376 RepID=UPI002D4086E6|nr:hypothetical protein [Bradyrhizobium sp.]HZR77033.1 hypothetical protein [Bradyrhizobium sp.]